MRFLGVGAFGALAAGLAVWACAGSDPDPVASNGGDGGSTSGTSGTSGGSGTSGQPITDAGCDPNLPWGTPELLPPPINTAEKFESGGRLSDDGLTLVFHRGEPRADAAPNQQKIHIATRSTVGAPWAVEAAGMTKSFEEADPVLTHDGRLLIYSGVLEGSTTGRDLLSASRDASAGPFGGEQRLSDLNELGAEYFVG